MKNKERMILSVLMATVFLVPLMGNTAMSDDIDTQIYYFNSYDWMEAWEKLPGDMVDGNEYTMAGTKTEGRVELCDGNNCSVLQGTIIKVEIRANASWCESQRNIILRPVFDGTSDGDNHEFTPTYWEMNYSEWFDITNDTNSPGYLRWTWSDVVNLDCDVEAENKPGGPSFVLACSIVQIRVTYMTY